MFRVFTMTTPAEGLKWKYFLLVSGEKIETKSPTPTAGGGSPNSGLQVYGFWDLNGMHKKKAPLKRPLC